MKVSTVRDFRDNATTFIRSKDPILVTRRGRLAGIFFPWPEETMPLELKREIFAVLSEQVRRQVAKAGVSEEQILTDFEAWRKKKRATRRRR
jgi:hypothetical protein